MSSSRQGVQLMALPTFFARSDVAHTNLFRGDFSKEDGQNETLGLFNKSSYESRDMVTFNMVDAFPTRPDPQILKKMRVKYVSDEQLQKVKKVFRIDTITLTFNIFFFFTCSSLKNVLYGLALLYYTSLVFHMINLNA